MKVLIVIPDLLYGGAARQLTLLLPALPREQFTIRAAVLGGESPRLQQLRQAGAAIEALGWRRIIQPTPFWQLRKVIRTFCPDLIHTWRLPALRAASLMTGRCPLVVSSPFQREGDGHAARLDRWLLGRARRIVVEGSAQVARCRPLKLAPGRVTIIPPAVAPGPAAQSPCPGKNAWPADARLVVCAGRLERRKGIHDALWAFDILQYLYSDLHLVIAGEGPEGNRLRAFAARVGAPERVHFIGWQEDLPALLVRAEVVWVPSLEETGRNVVLEAMAAGRPVIATRLPGLAEIVTAETGVLVAPGDKADLARTTRLLLENPEKVRQLGEAGQLAATRSFSIGDLARNYARLYEEVAG
jgi:glycosyltransferase involved in cell wall biosynthesis